MANASDSTMAIVNEIFAAFPGRFRFTSGCRTPAQNAAVNGVANSYHLTTRGCLAADFVPINGNFPSDELAQIAAIVAPHGYEVIKHNAGSGMHYHIEPNGSTPTNDETEPSTSLLGGTNNTVLIGLALLLFVVLVTD